MIIIYQNATFTTGGVGSPPTWRRPNDVPSNSTTATSTTGGEVFPSHELDHMFRNTQQFILNCK